MTDRPVVAAIGETINPICWFEMELSDTRTLRDVAVSGVGNAAEGTEILLSATTAPKRTSHTRTITLVGGSSGVTVVVSRGRAEARMTKEEWRGRSEMPVA
jgi:hypothetical protein